MTPKDKCDAWTLDMFGEDPSIEQIEAESRTLAFSLLRHPIWTEHKARLIAEYLRYFVFITRHGTYIDGFAGPQEPDAESTWAAKLVLETEPRWLRNFFLCELDQRKVELLKCLVDRQSPRRKEKKEHDRLIEVFGGDFNRSVHKVLSSGVITERRRPLRFSTSGRLNANGARFRPSRNTRKSGTRSSSSTSWRSSGFTVR